MSGHNGGAGAHDHAPRTSYQEKLLLGDIILTPRFTLIRPTPIDFEAAARLGANISDAERAAREAIVAAAIARANRLQGTIERSGVDNDPRYDDVKFVEDVAKNAGMLDGKLQPNKADEAGYKLANDSIPPKRSNRIEY